MSEPDYESELSNAEEEIQSLKADLQFIVDNTTSEYRSKRFLFTFTGAGGIETIADIRTMRERTEWRESYSSNEVKHD